MKREKVYNILLIIILLISSFCYEVHIFKYYSLIQMIVSGLLILLFLVYTTFEKDNLKIFSKVIRKELYIIVLFFIMFINTLLGNELYSLNSFSNILSSFILILTMITMLFVIPDMFCKYPKIKENFINYYILFCILLSIFSLILELCNGKLGPYTYVFVRNASIFYDPNFLAMILGVGLMILIMKKQKKTFKILQLILIGYAIFLTGSRGTILSIAIALLIYVFIFSKMNILKKILLLTAFLAIALILIKYLYNIDFFRIYQGSNHRIDMINSAFQASLKSPIIGYGYGSVTNYLLNSNFVNASTHNSFVDYLFAYGYPCFFIYVFIICKILIHALKNEKDKLKIYILPIIFMLINANTILYSLGGVGMSSMMFTIFLGSLNYSYFVKEEKKVYEN